MSLPVILQLTVESTNGTTCLKGLEAVCDALKMMHFPDEGVFVDHHHYRVTVTKSNMLLPPVEPAAALCRHEKHPDHCLMCAGIRVL